MTEDLGEILRRLSTPSFESIGALMSAEETGSVSDEEFDRNLWILLSRQVRLRGTHINFPKPVLHYYASHLMESDVANGGFAQASYNIPELFEAAADGFFKKSSLADLANDLDSIGWWAASDRLAYVRQHRTAFVDLE